MPADNIDWSQWFYVFAPFQLYLIIVMILVCYGDHGDETNIIKQFFRRISNCLERWTGFPGWAMAGGLTALLMLGTAALGLYWDVGYHIDFGRDQQLFTPSHTMIVLGLGGLIFAAVIAVIFASLDEAPVGVRVGPLRVPWSAVGLGAMGIGGLAAFPLDAIWHDAYGIDVTLWSPTHLQLVAGGSIATLVLWLMAREGRPAQPTLLGRAIEVTYFGAILTGVSTFQGEFDFGVPQFQVLYLPILIAVAAGFALVLGRVALGPWGAVKTAIAFLIIRGVIALLVGGPFNETIPLFPLYLVAALAVEGVAHLLGTKERLRFALVAGAAAGTVGVAADLIWLGAINEVQPSTAGLAKAALLAPLAAVAAAVLAGALSRPVAGTRVPGLAAAAAGVVLLLVVVYPLPRNVGDVQATVRLTPVGTALTPPPPAPQLPGVEAPPPPTALANVEVQLQPADAADNASAFGAVSWQGGGRVSASFEKVGPGLYRSSEPLPVSGTWKSVVGLQRGDEVMAAPIYLPADPEIGALEIPAVPERTEPFVRNTKLLLRESHAGDPSVAVLAYSGLALVVAVWIGLFALVAAKSPVLDDDDEREGHGGPPAASWRLRPEVVAPAEPAPAPAVWWDSYRQPTPR